MSGLPGVNGSKEASIVQGLGKIQQADGYLTAAGMSELADRLKVHLHRVHEVAGFFPLYKLEPGPEVDVRVCRDIACHLRGAPKLQESLQRMAGDAGVTDSGEPGRRISVRGVSCLGQCDGAPAVCINDRSYPGLGEEEIRRHVKEAAAGEAARHHHAGRQPLGWKIDPYDGDPRYEAIEKLVATRDSAGRLAGIDDLLAELKTSTLSGMGGARFPTHAKWESVRAEEAPVKYVVCNGDECEPGTFKDRELLRRAPHLLVEGMVLAGLAVGGTRGYIYIRHEYHEEIAAVEEAIGDAARRGCCGEDIMGSGLSFPVEVFVSPGGYICGEETALLEAMEDRRAEPRNKPPFPTVSGLRGRPTVINNVETLMWTPAIYLKGGAWYRDQGVNGGSGLWFCSISGDVNKPGVYEVPFGITVRDLVFKRAGGMTDGQKLKAIGTSGPSGGFMPVALHRKNLKEGFKHACLPDGADHLDVLGLPLDYKLFGSMSRRPPLQYMLGAAFVAVGDRADMVDLALNLTEFFRNESCGKCVPCRLGSQKLVDLLKGDGRGGLSGSAMELGQDLGRTMVLTSICGLGQVAPNPLLSLMEHFPHEVAAYVDRHSEHESTVRTMTMDLPVLGPAR